MPTTGRVQSAAGARGSGREATRYLRRGPAPAAAAPKQRRVLLEAKAIEFSLGDEELRGLREQCIVHHIEQPYAPPMKVDAVVGKGEVEVPAVQPVSLFVHGADGPRRPHSAMPRAADVSPDGVWTTPPSAQPAYAYTGSGSVHAAVPESMGGQAAVLRPQECRSIPVAKVAEFCITGGVRRRTAATFGLEMKEEANRIHMERSRMRGLIKLEEMLGRRLLVCFAARDRHTMNPRRRLAHVEARHRELVHHAHARGLALLSAEGRFGELWAAARREHEVLRARFTVDANALLKAAARRPSAAWAAAEPAAAYVAPLPKKPIIHGFLPHEAVAELSAGESAQREELEVAYLRTLSTSSRRFSILQRWQWISEQYALNLDWWRRGAVAACAGLAASLEAKHAALAARSHRDVITGVEGTGRKRLQVQQRKAHRPVALQGQEVLGRRGVEREEAAALRGLTVEYELNRPDKYYFSAVYAEKGERRILGGQEQLEFMLIYNEWHSLFHEVKKREKAEEQELHRLQSKHRAGEKAIRTGSRCGDPAGFPIPVDDDISASDLQNSAAPRRADGAGHLTGSTPTPVREHRSVNEKYGYGAGYNIFDFSNEAYVDTDAAGAAAAAAAAHDPNTPCLAEYSVARHFYPSSGGRATPTGPNPRTKHIGRGAVMEGDGRSWWLQYDSDSGTARGEAPRQKPAAQRPSSACAQHAAERARARQSATAGAASSSGTWFTSDFPKQQKQTPLVPKRPKSAAHVRKSGRNSLC